MKKAYSGDIIKVTKSIENSKLKIGDIYTVDLRQSDLGACDDNVVIVESGEGLFDGEYEIIGKINNIHFSEELNEILTQSDNELLANFKNGVQGESEFSKFMYLVRLLIK